MGSKFENLWPIFTQISGTKGFGDCGIVNPLVVDWTSLFGLIEFVKIEVSNGSIGEPWVTTPFWLKYKINENVIIFNISNRKYTIYTN